MPATLTMAAAMSTAVPRPMAAIIVALGRIGLPLLRRGLRRLGLCLAHAALDDLVEFAPIQPDAPALGTIIDLNALAIAHDQVDPARGTKKAVASVSSNI